MTITAGEHEGDLVRLYYDDIFMADGWKCVTLREADGGYHFVSNQTSKKPAIPTVLPEGADVPEDVESPAFRESIIEALDFIFIP